MSESQNAPIVLVHGILGFNQLRLAGMTIVTYFRLIPEALRNAGHVVPEPPALNPAGSVAERAAGLKSYLENNAEVARKKVHLIAHSMGGLDSRFMISQLAMADRVLSLTTICTPHHGSPLADIVETGAGPLLSKLSSLGFDVKATHDLTTRACRQFNENIEDDPAVAYFSISGHVDPSIVGPGSLVRLTHDLIAKTEGANDGIVSAQSATFAERETWTALDSWNANHFRVINWGADVVPNVFELADNSIVDKYVALVANVKARTL
jgi:triacylglycerol lipase